MTEDPGEVVVYPLAVWATWAVCLVGAVASVFAENWTALAFAVVAALNATGWALATRRWREWRGVALRGEGIINSLTGRPDGPPLDDDPA